MGASAMRPEPASQGWRAGRDAGCRLLTLVEKGQALGLTVALRGCPMDAVCAEDVHVHQLRLAHKLKHNVAHLGQCVHGQTTLFLQLPMTRWTERRGQLKQGAHVPAGPRECCWRMRRRGFVHVCRAREPQREKQDAWLETHRGCHLDHTRGSPPSRAWVLSGTLETDLFRASVEESGL